MELKIPMFAKNEEEPEKDEKMLELDDIINEMMKISKLSREEVCKALYGTSFDIKNAYLYLKDNEKYDKYFFMKTDDYIIKNLEEKGILIKKKNFGRNRYEKYRK